MIKSQLVYGNVRGCILEVSVEGIEPKFVYHFVYPNLGVCIFFGKEKATEKKGADYETGDSGTIAHLHCGLKKILCRAL